MAVKILRNYYYLEAAHTNPAKWREISDSQFLTDHNLTEDDVDIIDLGFNQYGDDYYVTEFRVLTFWQKLLRRICGE